MIVAGWIVVRRPEANSGPFRNAVPKLGDIYYQGADRQRWADVFDEDFYSGRAPEEIQPLARALKSSGSDFTGIDLCKDVEVARKLLRYSNRHSDLNELIAVRSPQLEELKGAIQIDDVIDWIGYDIIATGEWSLIAEGIFRTPEYYSTWLPCINRFGLLDDKSLLAKYESTYRKAALEGISEPIAPIEARLGVLFIEVGRVRFQNRV